ncbi:uncharacterized protein FOMMEDRAFT_152214 [Fomitiporia mediterranea MF3/22]|uniref:uncharacterized protein n=1 Tax=Fomitiporia mediterranea (strain MF3/22) TaxID=694068 RepID=UPI0004409485|nr:uncharacterized protein FOMMEDRAFT_152214 [Fomitiporia mediterranea MF3/22]EJD06889.1 hypothetical protein FOMMEDRAFT_152214 [Fomitiporia mediterranea MF3/22]
MAPSFFETSSPSLLTASAVPHSAVASGSHQPTLAVVLGLVGVLCLITVVAGVCIYIFRGRLFSPAAPINDEENTQSQEKNDMKMSETSSCLSDEDETLANIKPKESDTQGTVLRPFLLSIDKPTGSQYKELRLPTLQRTRTDPVRCHSKAILKHNSMPYDPISRDVGAPSTGNIACSVLLRASQSCPAVIELIKINLNVPATSTAIEEHYESTPMPLELTEKPSQPLSSLPSSDSSDSVYSQSSCSSTPSSPFFWDDYLNNMPDDLFYKPEPEPMPSPSASPAESQAETLCAPVEDSVETKVDAEELELQKPSEITPEPHIEIQVTSFVKTATDDKKKRTTSLKRSSVISNRKRTSLIRVRSRSRRGKLQSAMHYVKRRGSNFRTSHYQKRASITDPFLIPAFGEAEQSLSTSSDSSRPTFKLNDEPADDSVFKTPPRFFNRLTSPTRNPTLLNTRWKPRPVIPPLTITVFSRDRSANATKYPGRRFTISPPAGTTLAEFRRTVERTLGLEVRALRGMVFIGKRSMFLPLLTERFYVQWAKERMREGGIGVVEAWHTGIPLSAPFGLTS